MFKKDPAKQLAKIDAPVSETQKTDYPVDTCAVSTEKLGGEMGDPIDYVIGTRLVRVCCKGSVKMFEKNPAKNLARVGAHSDHGDHGEGGGKMTVHRWLGTPVGVWAVVILPLCVAAHRPEERGRRSLPWYRLTLFVGAAAVAANGFFGGAMIYGLDHYAW